MKQLAVLALIGSVSAVSLKQKSSNKFIENVEEYDKEIWGGDDHVNMQSRADIQMQSDPIAGSLGFPQDDPDMAMGVGGIVERDLASRRPVKYELDEGVTSTDDSIGWAEKELGRKLVPYKPKTLAEAYDPSKAPDYPNPWSSYEDDDAAGTLKSAHLAEWIHGYHGDHHHDKYYKDAYGKRHYQLPYGGYEGPGHDHYGKNLGHGNYGKYNPDGEAKEGWEDSVGYYKGGEGEGDEGEGGEEGGEEGGDGKKKGKKGAKAPHKLRKWWLKLEKDPHNGMSARKEYDDVAGDLYESGQYDMKTLARILLERENAKQAAGVSKRLSKQERDDAKEVARALAGGEEARKALQRQREGEEAEEMEKATKKTKEKIAKDKKKEEEEKAEQEKIDDEEREKAAKAEEEEEKNEEQAKREVQEELKKEKREKNEDKAQGRKARADKALAENKADDLPEDKAEKYNKNKDIKKAREGVEKGEKDDEEEKEEAREKAKEEDEEAAQEKAAKAAKKKAAKKGGEEEGEGGDDDGDKKEKEKTKLEQLQEKEEADEKLKQQGIAELDMAAGEAELAAKKRAAEEKAAKAKEDRKVKKQLEKEDAAREEALEEGKEPPKPQGLAQASEGPVIEGVPVENVNLPYLSGDAMDIDDPEPQDMLQTASLEQNSADEQLEEGSFIQMRLSNQSKLERIIRYSH